MGLLLTEGAGGRASLSITTPRSSAAPHDESSARRSCSRFAGRHWARRPALATRAVLFVRLVDDAGTTVLDRPFDWPADEQQISPGRYDLAAYWRACD